MKLPDLPEFKIPPECESPTRKLTLEEYAKWVQDNVLELKKKGIYRKLQDDPSRIPTGDRFVLEE